jgi:hypothetical protein
MDPKQPESTPDRDKDRDAASPSGPQHGHVDEAAGGADSSPEETAPAGEKEEAARQPGR